MVKQKKNYSRPKGKKFNGKNQRGAKNYKKPKSEGGANGELDRKRRNFKFIKRSKDAEEQQRRQKITEDKYKQQSAVLNRNESSDDDAEDVEEENPFEELMSTFDGDEKGHKLRVIDSSSEEEDEGDVEEEEDILDEEEGDEELLDEEELGEEEEEIDEEEEIEDEDAGEEEGESEAEGEEEEEEEAELDEEVEVAECKKDTESSDVFSLHLERELSQKHLDNLLSKPAIMNRSKLSWPVLGNLQIEISSSCQSKVGGEPSAKKKKALLDDEESFATEGVVPKAFDLKKDTIDKFQIKPKIEQNIAYANSINVNTRIPFTPLQSELMSIITNYQDIFYANRNLGNAEEIRFTYCLHALNHMTKTRSKILHHNAKLTAAAAHNKKATSIVPDAYRDQGLVRTKILIVVPFRESAYRVMNILIKLIFGSQSDSAKTNGSIINYKRFLEEFTGDTIRFPKTNPKPEDYEKTFAGNTDDTFRIGLSLTKKCMKLYTEFYSSDILIVSPLGLRMIVGAAGDADRDYDFLTSIELLILDQAELFFAQNWDHLLHVLDHMHLQPQTVRNTDFSRVRPWCLNGLSKFYRQTLLFSSHELPEIRSLFNSKCSNYRGKVRVANPVLGGTVRNVIVQVPQVFHKIDISSLDTSFDDRFKYFVSEILPQYKSPSMAHCMIYIPSYFDFVRIRNYFKAETINSVQICEYTTDAKISRARDMFFHSAAHFLLYSERAHFFRRTRIKGVRHLIMYQPPNFPNLYPELINLMQESNQNPRDGLESSMSVTILYSKYDMVQVSSIIGTERASKMIHSGKTTHMFMTGSE